MRILFLTENFPPETNAAATRVHERACYWVKSGHDVTIITQAPNFPQGRLMAGYRNRWRQVEERDGMRVVRVKTYIAANDGFLGRTVDFVSFMITAVIVSLFERRPDVVVATSPQFFAAVAGWMVGALRRAPFVFELGDLWPASIVAVGAMRQSRLLRMIETLELFLYRRAAVVVALTASFKDDLVSRGIAADKIAIVINGVDLPRYAPRPRDEDLARAWNLQDRFVIGYVGTHGMAHGLHNVIAAAEITRDRHDLAFLLAGPGAERDALIADAKARGLNNVIFLPPQPKEAMPAVWSLCDVALVHLKDSPVFADVIPSKIFEAMAMGLPILMSLPKGEATAIIEGEGVGLCVAPEDPQALANAAVKLLDDRELRNTLAEAAQDAAPGHSREFQASAMMAALEAAAAGDGGRAAQQVAAIKPEQAA